MSDRGDIDIDIHHGGFPNEAYAGRRGEQIERLTALVSPDGIGITANADGNRVALNSHANSHPRFNEFRAPLKTGDFGVLVPESG